MHWQKGFSLIELLIVVAVIGVISSIAVPSYISSRRAAKEAAAISTMRTLISAEGAYFSSNGSYSRYCLMSELDSLNLIEKDFYQSSIDGGSKNGYLFQITQPDPTRYVITATPQMEASLMRHFYADESGLIRENLGAPATASSTPVSSR
jgi:prepilin-type N-terminal cleavage/methylation domain-containing protein